MGMESIPKHQIGGLTTPRVTDDVRKLKVFRFGTAKGRIIGLRLNRVFEVYMIDAEGRAYSHE